MAELNTEYDWFLFCFFKLIFSSFSSLMTALENEGFLWFCFCFFPLPRPLFCVVGALLIVPILFQPAIWIGFMFYFVLSCCFLAVASTSNFVHNEQNRRKTNTIAKYVIILCIFSMLFADHMHIICSAAKSIWASVNYLWDCNSFMVYFPIYFDLNGLVVQLGEGTGKGLWTKFLLN